VGFRKINKIIYKFFWYELQNIENGVENAMGTTGQSERP
jgi:hypothetical protein